MIIPLCDRWHVPPSVIEKEDPEVFRLVMLYDLAHPGRDAPEPEG